MFKLYSLLFTVGVIVSAPYYLWRYRGRSHQAAGWRERLGALPPSYQQTSDGAIWIHAVSVGETLAVAGLVRELQQRYPNRKIFLSHVTPTGRATGEGRLPDVAGRFYLPLDWRWSVERVLRRIRPSLLVIAETELWPNLFRSTHDFGTRVAVVNARLSERSCRGYRRLRPFMRRVFDHVDRVCAQSSADAERFCSIGAPRDRVVVTGNLKFDAEPPASGVLAERVLRALRNAARGPVLVAASTMPGEENPVLDAWQAVRQRHQRALMILAPRHPNRCETVGQMLLSQGVSFLRRSTLKENECELVSQLATTEVLLLDTIGELAGLFRVADVVFMGGSLVPTGGHNLLEPAYWAKPTLFGPHMENFRDAAELFLDERAAIRVEDSTGLARGLLDVLGDADLCGQMGQQAKRVLERESGATGRVLDQLARLLDAPPPIEG
jgi:3-deoxy-D-manno-octulosonic-acid transferase